MRNYTTIQGDMWDSIAKKFYGDEKAMKVLLNANKQYIDVVVFSAGVVLSVPDYEAPTPNLLPPWRR